MEATEDQQLHDLIINKDWGGALALIDPSRDEEKEEILRKINYGDVSPLILIIKNGYDDLGRDLCFQLIDIGGEALVNSFDDDGSALHYCCRLSNGDIELIRKLVEVGGMSLISMPEKYDRQTALYHAHFPEEARIMVNIGGKELVTMKDFCGRTVLHVILSFFDDDILDTISLLLEVGGEELVMMTDRDDKTALHYAFDPGLSMAENEMKRDIVHDMLEVGGRKLAFSTDRDGRTALHEACTDFYCDPESISRLLAKGGEKLALITDFHGITALHCACEFNKHHSDEVYRQLLEVGGEKLLLMSDRHGSTALHLASKWMWKYNPEIFHQMLEIGKEKLIFMTDKYGRTALHQLCIYMDELHPKAVELVLELGGENILLKVDGHGRTALHYVCERSYLNTGSINSSIDTTLENPSLLNKIETVYRMVDMGRIKLLLIRDLEGRTAIMIELQQERPTLDIIDRFLEIAGNDIILAFDE